MKQVLKLSIKSLILLFTLAVIFSCKENSKKVSHQESLSDQVGKRFKIEGVLDSTGHEVQLDFTKSDLTIIDFWFNDCPACIEEMKQFAELLRGRENKIKIISISINQFWLWKNTLNSHSGRFSFLANVTPNWKHYVLKTTQDPKLKNAISIDREQELQELFNVSFFPAYFVIDKNGIIQSRPESAVEFIHNQE